MKVLVFTALALILAGAQAIAQDRGYDWRSAPPPAPPGYAPPPAPSGYAPATAYERPASAGNTKFAWADVLRVDPVYERVSAAAGGAHEECEDVPVERPADNGNRGVGTMLGAIVGGVLGSTVGKGDGRTAATVAGAVAGGAVGNNVAANGNSYPGTQRRCRMVQDAPPAAQGVPASDARRVVAYDVQYRYRGDVYMSRLSYDPGDRLRLRVSIEPIE